MRTLLLRESPYLILFIIIAWAAAAYLGRISGAQWPSSATAAIAAISCLSAAAFIYREPDLTAASFGPDVVCSPADGRLMWTERSRGPATDDYANMMAPEMRNAQAYRVRPQTSIIHSAIFLSPLDIHVQIVPIDSRVIEVRPRGSSWSKWPAMFAMADHNQAVETLLRPSAWPTVLVKVVQISGLLLPRAVSFLGDRSIGQLPHGDYLPAGSYLGMIKFGSRVDIIVEFGPDVEVKSLINLPIRIGGPMFQIVKK
jgi:phosphatidylserine decarboxylase precursor-related protein